ncbi:hypothetical protein [Bacillus nitroreducens]
MIFKVEGDVGADPIWCGNCDCNVDLENITISNGLKKEFIKWARRYGEWIDWVQDQLNPNGIEMEREHNKQGAILTEKIQKELQGTYKIKYTSSTMASMYQKNK